MIYLPPIAHVIPLTTIRRARKLPSPGAISVQLNQRVMAQDVIAEMEPTPTHRFIDLADALGTTEREALRHLRREPGDRVEKGDLIAGPVGVMRRTVRAPSRGRIVALMGAKLLFERYADPIPVRAGFPGTVVSTDGVQMVAIETVGALVQCVWGNEKRDFGVMRIVGASPRESLMTDKLDIELRGAVLVAGVCDHPAPLQQARELAVRGIILGSMSSELIPIAREMPYPIVVIEGFGQIPIDRPTYDLLISNQGREVAVDGTVSTPYDAQRPEVIIPLPVSNPVDMPEELIALAPGVRVRVIAAPYMGEVGVVQEMLPHAVGYASGILARSAKVELPSVGTVAIPLANLEVLQ